MKPNTYFVVISPAHDKPKIYKALSTIAGTHPVSRKTLSKHINKSGEYLSESIKVYQCDVIRGKQRGRKLTQQTTL